MMNLENAWNLRIKRSQRLKIKRTIRTIRIGKILQLDQQQVNNQKQLVMHLDFLASVEPIIQTPRIRDQWEHQWKDSTRPRKERHHS